VDYEFAGRRYTTQTSQPPGATIPVQVSAMGVTTSSTSMTEPGSRQTTLPWQNVIPEPGAVVSGAGMAAQPVPQTIYVPPTYAYGTPLYAAPYSYAPSFYPAPAYSLPIGLSLNFGYSRGWGGNRGRWR